MKIKVEINGQTYHVDVEDIHVRPVIAVVDGERYEVWSTTESTRAGTSDSAARPVISAPQTSLPAAGSSTPTSEQGDSQLTAPLPGVIVAILVKPGDKVSRGQELCTLEAMKMKNAIRANHDGIVETIDVNMGDLVSHGQALMTFKE